MFSFDLQVAAAHMLDDLSHNRLCVIKIRKDDTWVRLPIESNPDWYSKFCNEYMKKRKRYRKLRTFIKRRHVISALYKILNDSNIITPYINRLLPYVSDYAKCRL